ncbi:MAG: hypothetical protein WC554_16590 [Clostridia bacterium]
MKKIKINLHSIIDLITNSSTEIYTYSSGSVAACKEMIDEFFKVTGVNKTCDDVFELSVDTEEGTRGDYDQFEGESFLIISPKSPEFSNLAILVRKFLYSTHHEACYNG